MPGGVDIAGVVYGFLNAVPNMNSQAALVDHVDPADQQKRVVQAMMNYMTNYIAWADGGFVDATLHSKAATAQINMIETIQGLFQGNANVYYPTNTSGPQ
jgi:hypothetical protein